MDNKIIAEQVKICMIKKTTFLTLYYINIRYCRNVGNVIILQLSPYLEFICHEN